MKLIRNISDRSIKVLFLAGIAASVLLLTTVFTLQPFSAEAGGRFGPSRSPEEIVERLKDRLDLTEEQVEAIRPIIEEKVQMRNELREEYGTDRRAIRTEMQELKRSTELKLGDVLTEEQMEKYQELRQERREQMQRGKKRGGRRQGAINKSPEQVISRLTERLELTEDQVTAITPIIEKNVEQRREIFDSYKGEGRQLKDSMRNEMQTIGEETETQLSSVLTDEQMEKFLEFREERRERMGKRMYKSGPDGLYDEQPVDN